MSMFDFLSHVDTELELDGQKVPDIFGGRVPPIGSKAHVKTHVSHFPEPPYEPDDEGFVHVRFEVVSVDYEVVLGEGESFHKRRAVVKGVIG